MPMRDPSPRRDQVPSGVRGCAMQPALPEWRYGRTVNWNACVRWQPWASVTWM
jgi:hypothetical protein